LYVSFDFGSTQNCCVVAQKHEEINEFPTIKNFYVEHETLNVLIDQFTTYYAPMQEKTVILRGGSDGNKRNDAMSRESYFDVVTKKLISKGWRVELRAASYEIPHMDKFLFWQKYLSGNYPQLPSFSINMNNAIEAYTSMDNAPVLPDEIRKDKRSERKTDQPRWKATDLSDAMDNLYYWELIQMLADDDSFGYDVRIG
jgi:hypothetical protein